MAHPGLKNTASAKELLALLVRTEQGAETTFAVPEGWFTIHDIREELRMNHTRNASTRAHDLWRIGVVDRKLHRFTALSGQCHKGYIYRPKAPFKSIADAARNYNAGGEDPVPAGYVRIVEFAASIHLTHVAVREKAKRYNLKGINLRTRRSNSGLNNNVYYREADLKRLYPGVTPRKPSR